MCGSASGGVRFGKEHGLAHQEMQLQQTEIRPGLIAVSREWHGPVQHQDVLFHGRVLVGDQTRWLHLVVVSVAPHVRVTNVGVPSSCLFLQQNTWQDADCHEIPLRFPLLPSAFRLRLRLRPQ